MKTDEDKIPEVNQPIKKCALLEEHKAYWMNRQKESIPNNLKTYDDVMKDVYEAISECTCEQSLLMKLKAKGYHPEKKWANGEVGDWDQLNGNIYRIQITDRDEWGEYPIAWVIDVEVQKIFEF